MRPPLIVGTDRTLKIGRDPFAGIGRLDESAGILEVNVRSDGKAGFEWILDADGNFRQLTSNGVLSRTLFQRAAFLRARERFGIAPSRSITAGELRDRIARMHDQFSEAPHVSDLKEFLAPLAPDHVLTRADMRRYLGE